MKKIKAVFIKNGPGVGYGYFVGDTTELDPKAFNDLEELGIVRAFDPKIDAPKPQNDIPTNIPGYKKLIGAGYTSLADIKATTDLTEIKGIGKMLAKQITKYLQE